MAYWQLRFALRAWRSDQTDSAHIRRYDLHLSFMALFRLVILFRAKATYSILFGSVRDRDRVYCFNKLRACQKVTAEGKIHSFYRRSIPGDCSSADFVINCFTQRHPGDIAYRSLCVCRICTIGGSRPLICSCHTQTYVRTGSVRYRAIQWQRGDCGAESVKRKFYYELRLTNCAICSIACFASGKYDAKKCQPCHSSSPTNNVESTPSRLACS